MRNLREVWITNQIHNKFRTKNQKGTLFRETGREVSSYVGGGPMTQVK